ncbi:hypothetical protein GR7B_00056 [Vibrio phage vB_VcorM_GR7B]|nr:hypothetical protein GR7B_00056 [Vibrio phage vB_VcorM_GR7B]
MIKSQDKSIKQLEKTMATLTKQKHLLMEANVHLSSDVLNRVVNDIEQIRATITLLKSPTLTSDLTTGGFVYIVRVFNEGMLEFNPSVGIYGTEEQAFKRAQALYVQCVMGMKGTHELSDINEGTDAELLAAGIEYRYEIDVMRAPYQVTENTKRIMDVVTGKEEHEVETIKVINAYFK